MSEGKKETDDQTVYQAIDWFELIVRLAERGYVIILILAK